jgi:hypothetical protein
MIDLELERHQASSDANFLPNGMRAQDWFFITLAAPRPAG